MKRSIIFSVTLFYFIGVSAQTQFGVFAGIHGSSVLYAIKNVKQADDSKLGFHLGVDCKIPFENRLTFVPSLSYKLMGYKVTFNQPSYPPDLLATDNDTRFHEIDVDPLLQYDVTKSSGHLFLRAGPSFNFIVSGKEKYNLSTGETIDRNMKFSVTHGYGRYLAGIVAQLGFETSDGLTIYAHYVQHLISMNNEQDGPSIRNRMVGITIGKFFKPGKK
ncbi:MAG TPA: porin family protein [Chitinophagaceae bacterium]|nr:porin family protein [Chitinophagaceae bacterium]